MEYQLGALKNPKDNRDIQLAQVQTPVAVPNKYITDISMIPVLNQKSIGACVGYAHTTALMYLDYKENGKVPSLSPRYIYGLSKRLDGIPNIQGTYPRVACKVMFNKGCTTNDFLKNNADLSHEEYVTFNETPYMSHDAIPYKIKGYAEVANDKESLKQAIFQNGVVAITINVGNHNNPIKYNPLKSFGLHRVLLYGYNNDKFFYRNSWGDWGANGNGYFFYEDQKITDALAFIDLPNKIIEEAKKKYKYFSDVEVAKYKLVPELWQMLDKAREIAGIPFIITSGYRTKEHNTEVGGVENSSHLLGEAVDISARNSNEHFLITKGLMLAGFTRISKKYPSHVHCDISKDKEQNVLF